MNVATCFKILLVALFVNGGPEMMLFNHRNYRIAGRARYSRIASSNEENVQPGDFNGVIPRPYMDFSGSQFENRSEEDEQTDESRLKFVVSPPERTHRPWLQQEKTVKIHIYRGPNKKYVDLKHIPEQKYFAPWGYFVSQPVGSHKGQSIHELSFHYS